MKALLGSAVFLASVLLMRQILVGAGILGSNLALLFVLAAVGLPLGGIVFVEAALDHESRSLREEIRTLREEVAALKRALPGARDED